MAKNKPAKKPTPAKAIEVDEDGTFDIVGPPVDEAEERARELNDLGADEWDALELKRAELVEKRQGCDTESDGGKFEAEAIEAEIEEIDKRIGEIRLDWLVAIANEFDKRAELADE